MEQSSSGRLKRMRSDGPLRPCFNQDDQPRITPDPTEQDADLQNSIRVQDAASKRARLSFSVDDSGSPIAPLRRSRFVEGTMRDVDSSAPSSGFSAAFRNALTPVWSGVSGVFGRRSIRDMTASAASTQISSLQGSTFSKSTIGGRLGAYDARRTHSSQSNNSSTKDSGIYFMGGRESEKSQSWQPSLDSSAASLRAVLNLSPTLPQAPAQQDPDHSVSPLKRLLHKASVSSLRKVRSHFALPSLRRAPAAGSESPEKIPAVPAIPEQFLKADTSLKPQQSLKAQPSRVDLKKRQKLAKRMSSLQVELEKCKQQYASTFGPSEEDADERSLGIDVDHVQSNAFKQEDVVQKVQTTRPLPPFPSHFQPTALGFGLQAPVEFTNEFSPSKKNAKLTALPQMPISPDKPDTSGSKGSPQPAEAMPSIEAQPSPSPSKEIEKTLLFQSDHSVYKGPSYPSDSAAYTDAITSTWEWNLEQNRRSLSTILSSRANSPDQQSPPLSELAVVEPRAPITRAAKKNAAFARAMSAELEHTKQKQENRPNTSRSANDATDPSRSNSLKISRIPRHSPRKQMQQRGRAGAEDLPQISAIRSPPRRLGGAGSPRKRSETEGVHKKRRPKKKSVGSEELGYYNEGGEWVWSEEAF